MKSSIEIAEEMTGAERQVFSRLNGVEVHRADPEAKKRHAEKEVAHIELINRAIVEGRSVGDVLAEAKLNEAIEVGDVPGAIAESRAEVQRIEAELEEARVREQDNHILFDSYISLRDALAAGRTRLQVARLQLARSEQSASEQKSLADREVLGSPENSMPGRFGIAFQVLTGFERAAVYFRGAVKALECEIVASETALAEFKLNHKIQ